MKNVYKYFCLVLFLTGFIQINSKAENSATVAYSKMSAAELDAAFILAVKEHHLEKMQELIQVGANVNTPVPYTWTSGDCDWDIKSTALMYAVRHNLSNMIKVLLKVKRKCNENLNEALKQAITQGYSDVVKELIKGGADINYKYEDQSTPLILAVKHAHAMGEFYSQAKERQRSGWQQRREIIQILLKAGAYVNCVNKHGRTALMQAVMEHDLNTVLDLLQVPEMNTGSFFGFGTKPINYADQDGNTALILAVKHIQQSYISGDGHGYNMCKNSQKIVEALLKSPGVDPHHVNNNGETAITLLDKLNKQLR